MFFIHKDDGLGGFRAKASHKDPRIDFFVKSAINSIPIGKFIDLVTFVNELHGVKPSVCSKIVASIIPVTSLRANCQEIADGRMMRNLLAVNLSAISE